jgi:hypothetical protein
MFAAIVLICAMSVARPDCDMTTAIRYSPTVGEWDLPNTCLAAAMTHAAELAGEDPHKWDTTLVGSDAYTKLSCRRSDFLNHG